MDTIPRDILKVIFDYIDFPNVLSLLPVCKYWKSFFTPESLSKLEEHFDLLRSVEANYKLTALGSCATISLSWVKDDKHKSLLYKRLKTKDPVNAKPEKTIMMMAGANTMTKFDTDGMMCVYSLNGEDIKLSDFSICYYYASSSALVSTTICDIYTPNYIEKFHVSHGTIRFVKIN